MRLILCVLLLAPSLAVLLPGRVSGDEGMWLFNHPPKELLKKKYGFEPTDAWLEHVQKSSVRFNNGGSGSFISPNGLVMTNHHVALDTLKKISAKGKIDYVTTGFYAKSPKEEAKSLDLELNVLMEIEDVTDRVKAAIKPDMSPEKAFAARRAIISEIEKESLDKTKLRSDVVTLYQGGQFHLYRYKRYTDVRLVFAPEQSVAFFGGDPDNFAFPRFDLDCAFFRVYEDGKPAKIEHYLKWSQGGAKKDELVFVSGHPGKTDRQDTVAELEYLRDVGAPFRLQTLFRWEVMYGIYSAESAEHAFQAKDLLFSVANSRKAYMGILNGLLDPTIMAKKKQDEAKLRQAVAKNPALKDAAKAWDILAKAQKVRAKNIRPYGVLEAGYGFNSTLFRYARTLVRAAEEFPKKNSDRLPEFSESAKKSMELKLFSEQEIFKDLEIAKMTDGLTLLCEVLGADNELVKKVMAGKSPQQRASELVLGSKLGDSKLRKELYKGGKKAVENVEDPMIVLAWLVDPESRKVRKIIEDEYEEPSSQAHDQIAKAKFEIEGANNYPDATFTLRLAFGTCKGYEENGKQIPFETDFAGMYARAEEHKNREPFNLPERWLTKKDKLNLKTPLNFVCTADIIGGNSGSPVVNKDAEVVGLIFDGNIQSLVLDFVYTEKQARAVAVQSVALTEALRAIFDAGALADEITGTSAKAP